jgi:hypothetical protein
MAEFVPSEKRFEKSKHGDYRVYNLKECDPRKYPEIPVKGFKCIDGWDGNGVDIYGDATYFYSMYDAIEKVDQAIRMLEEAQDCIANHDVSDYTWVESLTNLRSMRNNWANDYEKMRRRAIRELEELEKMERSTPE